MGADTGKGEVVGKREEIPEGQAAIVLDAKTSTTSPCTITIA